MIVKLPNKYTGESQLFLLEVTRNIGLFCDAFVDKMTQGVNIFRFYERLHFINAKIVSWVPLQYVAPFSFPSSECRDYSNAVFLNSNCFFNIQRTTRPLSRVTEHAGLCHWASPESPGITGTSSSTKRNSIILSDALRCESFKASDDIVRG
jgi:hypothetical protein